MNQSTDELDLFPIIIMFYLSLSVIPFLCGLIQAGSNWNNGCDKPMTRIEYIFPAFQIGCWMNSPLKGSQ